MRLLAVRRRPEIGAAVHVGAGVHHLVGAALPVVVVDLHALVRIVVDRLAGLGIDALGPIDFLGILGGLEECAVAAVEQVFEAVAVGEREDLRPRRRLAVDDDLRAAGVIIVDVVRRVLEMPLHLAGRGIERDGAVGEQVVTRPVRRIVARRRIAGAPIGDVGGRIVGAGDVERAAAGLPGVVIVFPGLAAGLARRRHRERLPFLLAGLGIERREPAAHAVVAAGAADDHGILERERRRGDLHVGLIVQVLVPDDLAGLLVGRDHPAVEAGDRDDEIAPQRDAAVAVGLLHARDPSSRRFVRRCPSARRSCRRRSRRR